MNVILGNILTATKKEDISVLKKNLFGRSLSPEFSVSQLSKPVKIRIKISFLLFRRFFADVRRLYLERKNQKCIFTKKNFE